MVPVNATPKIRNEPIEVTVGSDPWKQTVRWLPPGEEHRSVLVEIFRRRITGEPLTEYLSANDRLNVTMGARLRTTQEKMRADGATMEQAGEYAEAAVPAFQEGQ